MLTKFSKVITLVAVLSLVLTGCGQGRNVTGPGGITVVTSFYPMYIATINVTKSVPGVKVVNLTQPQAGCLHDYQLTPQDMKTLEKADVFVVNGAGTESFLEKVTKQQPRLKIIEASKGIPRVKDDHGEENPHVWVSVANTIMLVNNIAEQLAAVDSANAQRYRSNAAEYVQKLSALSARMHQALDSLPNKNIITFHEAFPYFAAEFNLNIVGVIEREPGTEPSPRELAEMIDKIKEWKVKALFAEPQYPSRAADTIARETGAKVYFLDPGVTGEAKPDAFDDYLRLMDGNTRTLVEALK